MHKYCAKNINFFDLLIKPKQSKLDVTDKKGNKQSLNVVDIFYIECKSTNNSDSEDRDIKKIHFCHPIDMNGKLVKSFEWKTRETFKTIFDKTGTNTFIQINKSTIVRSVLIQGRDSLWKNLQVIGFNSMTILEPEKLETLKLPIGRTYVPKIKKIIDAINLIEIKNSNQENAQDFIYINPTKIIFIQFTNELKKIHLDTPIYSSDIKRFEINWYTRMNAEELYLYFKKCLDQINRNTFVNLSFVRNDIKKGDKMVLLKSNNKKFHLNLSPIYYQKLIKSNY